MGGYYARFNEPIFSDFIDIPSVILASVENKVHINQRRSGKKWNFGRTLRPIVSPWQSP